MKCDACCKIRKHRKKRNWLDDKLEYDLIHCNLKQSKYELYQEEFATRQLEIQKLKASCICGKATESL